MHRDHAFTVESVAATTGARCLVAGNSLDVLFDMPERRAIRRLRPDRKSMSTAMVYPRDFKASVRRGRSLYCSESRRHAN